MKLKLLSRVKMEATFWLARRLPPCTELLHVMSQSLEREWTLRERVMMRLHFLYCEYCQRYLEQLRLMREAARLGRDKIYDAGAAPSTPNLSEEAAARLKRALRSPSE